MFKLNNYYYYHTACNDVVRTNYFVNTLSLTNEYLLALFVSVLILIAFYLWICRVSCASAMFFSWLILCALLAAFIKILPSRWKL